MPHLKVKMGCEIVEPERAHLKKGHIENTEREYVNSGFNSVLKFWVGVFLAFPSFSQTKQEVSNISPTFPNFPSFPNALSPL